MAKGSQHRHHVLASHSAWNWSLATQNHPSDGELIRGEAATIASLQVPPVDVAVPERACQAEAASLWVAP
jgi:hypothetical protein